MSATAQTHCTKILGFMALDPKRLRQNERQRVKNIEANLQQVRLQPLYSLWENAKPTSIGARLELFPQRRRPTPIYRKPADSPGTAHLLIHKFRWTHRYFWATNVGPCRCKGPHSTTPAWFECSCYLEGALMVPLAFLTYNSLCIHHWPASHRSKKGVSDLGSRPPNI